MTDSGPDPGAVVNFSLPRYEIRAMIGQGASAIVFRGWDRELGRTVAVKVLRDIAALSETARARFRREAQVAAGLSHPNLLTVFDAGESGGHLYLVMEFVEGKLLADVLAEGKRDVRALVAILEKAARGVAAAHAKGVIHRDLKPSNILLTASGEPKVGDFGLVHLLESSSHLTRTGATLGTPLYMSPEQVEGKAKELSPATDVYALGAILYETLTGRPPHVGETVMEIYGKISRVDPESPRKLVAGSDPDLETIALKALEKDPARRYPTAEAFAEDLRQYLAGEPIAARPLSAGERVWRRLVRHRAILAPTVPVLAVGLGLAGWALWTLSKERPLPATAAPETAKDVRPWLPVFDGKSLEFMNQQSVPCWEVVDGAIVLKPGRIDTAQSRAEFGDGDLRFRFEVRDTHMVFFMVRQTGEGSCGIAVTRPEFAGLDGKPVELVVACRGDRISAEFNGRAMLVEPSGKVSRKGQFQFGYQEGSVRFLSIDYRSP